jgi:hypothetical protein
MIDNDNVSLPLNFWVSSLLLNSIRTRCCIVICRIFCQVEGGSLGTIHMENH